MSNGLILFRGFRGITTPSSSLPCLVETCFVNRPTASIGKRNASTQFTPSRSFCCKRKDRTVAAQSLKQHQSGKSIWKSASALFASPLFPGWGKRFFSGTIAKCSQPTQASKRAAIESVCKVPSEGFDGSFNGRWLLRLGHENNYLSYTRNGFLATACAMTLLSQEELREGARLSAVGFVFVSVGTFQYIFTAVQLAKSLNLPLGYISLHSGAVCAGWTVGVSYCLGFMPNVMNNLLSVGESRLPCRLKSKDMSQQGDGIPAAGSSKEGTDLNDLLLDRAHYLEKRIELYKEKLDSNQQQKHVSLQTEELLAQRLAGLQRELNKITNIIATQ
eukprot:Nk52_evm4s260 gene=Nk52_evmTU4s260